MHLVMPELVLRGDLHGANYVDFFSWGGGGGGFGAILSPCSHPTVASSCINCRKCVLASPSKPISISSREIGPGTAIPSEKVPGGNYVEGITFERKHPFYTYRRVLLLGEAHPSPPRPECCFPQFLLR